MVASLLLHARPAISEDQPPGTLRIGIVNVGRVLSETPEYQQYSQEYIDDRKKLFNPGAAKNPSQFKNVLLQRKTEIQAAEQKWDKIKAQFTQRITDKIRQSSEQVEKDKKLDFVLMDAPWYPESPLRQFGAVDVTTDVLLAMKNTK